MLQKIKLGEFFQKKPSIRIQLFQYLQISVFVWGGMSHGEGPSKRSPTVPRQSPFSLRQNKHTEKRIDCTLVMGTRSPQCVLSVGTISVMKSCDGWWVF